MHAHTDHHYHRHHLRHGLHRQMELRHPNYRFARALSIGAVLIAIGVAWLVAGQPPWGLDGLWRWVVPALVAWSGLLRLVLVRHTWAVVSGLQRLGVAAWLYAVFNHVAGWTFQNSWPVLLLVAGVGMVAHSLLERRSDDPAQPAPSPGEDA